MEPRYGDSGSAADATSGDYRCSAIDATDTRLHSKGRGEVG
jgi:hypothetical protein